MAAALTHTPESEAKVSQPRSIIFSRVEPGRQVKLSEQKALNAIIYGFQDYVKKSFRSVNDYMRINGENNSVIFSMPKKKFFRLAGLDSTRNTKQIKDVLTALQTYKHTYDFSKGLKKDKYGSVSFIYRWDVDGDRIEFTLPYETRLAMLQEEHSATFCLNEINQKFMKASKYALFLYPALLSYRHTGTTGTQRIEIPDKKLKDALRIRYEQDKAGAKKYAISVPSRVGRQCIEPALKAINDASLEYEIQDVSHTATRDGEVTWLFTINQVIEPALAQFNAEHYDEIEKVKDRINQLGLRADSRTAVLGSVRDEKSLGYVQYCLAKLDEKTAKGKLASSAAYLWTIYTNNYDDFDGTWTQIKRDYTRRQVAHQKEVEAKIRKELSERRLQLLTGYANEVMREHSEISEMALTERFKEYCLAHNKLDTAANVFDRFHPRIQEERSIFILTEFGKFSQNDIDNLLASIAHKNVG